MKSHTPIESKNHFRCPECNTKVPQWKALFISNDTRITCSYCKSKLTPNLKFTTISGAIGGGSVSLVTVLSYYLLRPTCDMTTILFAACSLFLMIYGLSILATIKWLTFTVVNITSVTYQREEFDKVMEYGKNES